MPADSKDVKASPSSELSEYEDGIRVEMAVIRDDLAALTQSLSEYAKARKEDLQDRATEWSDEMLVDSSRAVKKLGKKVARLEKDLEVKVSENPVHWLLGALGVGLLVTMMFRGKGD